MGPRSAAAAQKARRARRRVAIGWTLLLGAVVGTVVLGLLPAPYVVERPGPVYDTLGTVQTDNGVKPLIDISGHPTYDTKGQLDLLTVYLDGSREQPLSWIEVATAWFNQSRSVVPVDAVFPNGQTDQEANQESTADMQQSQQEAVAAALHQLHIAYGVSVGSIKAGSPADGVLKKGDKILTVNGTTMTDIVSLRAAIAANGTSKPLSLGIERSGADQIVSLTPAPASPTDPTPIIGIEAVYDFPFDVTIQLQDVGGPSAGMMFALGTYDKLTPGALTGGQHLAGTGTISADGTVGPIGGIRQKMYGARDAGATWFLAPASNCDEVVGHIPSGIRVFKVSTLDDAITDTNAIVAGHTADLPQCTS